jgi:hypothetical protein
MSSIKRSTGLKHFFSEMFYKKRETRRQNLEGAADGGFESRPRAGVDALKLWDGVGEQESRSDGLIGRGEVGEREQNAGD